MTGHGQTVREAILHGGTVVDTPAEAPRIRSVISAAGDVMQFVTADATDDPALLARHAQEVEERLEALTGRRIQRIRKRIEQVAWVVSAGSWAWYALAREDLGRLTWAVVSSLLAVAIRWVAPVLLRTILVRLVRHALRAELATE